MTFLFQSTDSPTGTLPESMRFDPSRFQSRKAPPSRFSGPTWRENRRCSIFF